MKMRAIRSRSEDRSHKLVALRESFAAAASFCPSRSPSLQPLTCGSGLQTATALALTCLFACGTNQTIPVAHQPYQGAQAAPLACVPNLDGKIDSNELQVAIGVPESMLVNPAGTSRTVNLTGTTDSDGHRVWDMRADDGTDQLAVIQASDVASKWFASSFPAGQFAAPIDAADTLEGIYQHTDSAILLMGLASTQEHPSEGQTLLVYDQPVEIYRFPIQPGAQWVSVGTVANGKLRDLPYAGRDTYSVSVVESGILELPDLTFTQAMRVKTTVTVEPAVGASVTTQQSSWLFECFGEVARATSNTNETNTDFTTAAELRRLSLQRSNP